MDNNKTPAYHVHTCHPRFLEQDHAVPIIHRGEGEGDIEGNGGVKTKGES